jgi:hypothetical protein
VRERPEVRAAIEAVGRIEEVPLPWRQSTPVKCGRFLEDRGGHVDCSGRSPMTSSARGSWFLLLSATVVAGFLVACGGDDDGNSDSRQDGSPGPADAAGAEVDAGLDAAPARCGQAIATIESNPSGDWLGVDADFVYWIAHDGTNGEVRRIDRLGKGPEVALVGPSPDIEFDDVILLDDSHVYLVPDPVLTIA